MENYYEILNVVNFADIEIIKAAYRALVKKYHPDLNKNVDPNIIVKINEAYETLCDPVKKQSYDLMLKKHLEEISISDLCENDNVFNQSTDVESKDNIGIIGFRYILSIIVGIIFATIGGFILITVIPADGSWSFIGYTIYGFLIGSIMKFISGSDSSFLGFMSLCITIVCMSLPYYLLLFDNLPLIYGSMNTVDIFIESTKEIVEFFLGSGVIRLIFIILTPSSAFSAIVD